VTRLLLVLGIALLLSVSFQTVDSREGSSVTVTATPPGPVAPPPVIPPTAVGSSAFSSDDWPTYLHDARRSADNPTESNLSASNISTIVPDWTFTAGGYFWASPTVANGNVYVGAGDGEMYSVNAMNGTLVWKRFVGLDNSDTKCSATPFGVASSATVQDGTVYVGGGDSHFYALNATTGAILWNVSLGSTSSGHYIWSSPLIYHGYAYLGVASRCDRPLVQGQLVQLNLTSHQASFFNTTTPSSPGAGIWGSPTLDSATGTIFVGTGNGGTHSESVLALNASTLTLTGAWAVPPNQSVVDGDFGNTPTLFTDSHGDTRIEIANKDGFAYAFDANRLNAGPVWETTIAIGCSQPEFGCGSISPGAFDGQTLYLAGGITTVVGVNCTGGVRALDPLTGHFLWQHCAPGHVLGGLAYANGLVVDSAGRTLEVLNASNGDLLFHYLTNGLLYDAPTVAYGRIYVDTTEGTLYSFGHAAGAWRQLFEPPPTADAGMAFDAHDGYTVLFGGCSIVQCPTADTWVYSGGAWTNVTPLHLNLTNSPSPRTDPAMVYDSEHGYVLLFGGRSSSGRDLSDTWSFQGGVWTSLNPLGAPPARSSAAMTFDPVDGYAVLFGGIEAGPSGPYELGDTWLLQGSGASLTWTNLTASLSSAPSARHATTMFWDASPSEDRAVLYGGRSGPATLSDTWTFRAGAWTHLTPHSSPGPRFAASSTFDPKFGYGLLFGGLNATGIGKADTWRYLSGTWSQLTLTASPSARSSAALVFDGKDDYSLLFGGAAAGETTRGDLHRFTGTAWSAVSVKFPGKARYGQSAAFDAADGYVLVFGGMGSTGLLRQTEEFTGNTYLVGCTHCAPSSQVPLPRSFATMAYDAADGYVVLFAGRGPNSILDDTWTYLNGRWTNITPSHPLPNSYPGARYAAGMVYDAADGYIVLFGGLGPTGPLSDTWTFKGGSWHLIAAGTAPSARFGAAMAAGPAGDNSVVLFGGTDGVSVFNDTWRFGAGRWTPVSGLTVSPVGRAFASFAYDPVAGEFLLVGGNDSGLSLSGDWTFENSSWSFLTRFPAPSARSGAALVYDPATGSVLLEGGLAQSAHRNTILSDSWFF
jgi:outer membrane protein assembly factor BamB